MCGRYALYADPEMLVARFELPRMPDLRPPPAFRSAFRPRRCLIPADGFYEWKKAGRTRQPYFICLKDGLPLAFAGLWEEWRDPDGQAVGCCAIIVTRANALLQPIHERMPVIL
jgi:putative SOS response-associated peptidase YedK